MLNDFQTTFFQREGYVSGIPVAKKDEVTYFRQAFDQLSETEGQDQARAGFFDRHFEQRFIWELATHPKILDCVADVIGPDILLLSTHCFCKYGPEEKFVAWHQDLRYWGLEPPVEVTAWFAIDDSDQGNGCMQVVPRIHRSRLLEHGKSERSGNLLSINQSIDLSPEEVETAVDCVLRAGEISLHDGMLVHGSLPNRSSRRRCGMAIRYVPTHVRPITEGPMGTNWKWRPILVRGEDRHAHFDLQPRPFT